MKVRFDKIGYPLYCDIGPNAGDMLIDLTIRLYLSPEEYASYEGSKSLQITLSQNRDGCPQTGSTAEISGELPVGDVMAVGEAGLAVGRVGWTPVRGGVIEVCADEHGTHPLPLSGGPDAPRNDKEDPPYLSRTDENAPPALPGEPAMAREGMQVANKISKT
jgi:hypothetical protein